MENPKIPDFYDSPINIYMQRNIDSVAKEISEKENAYVMGCVHKIGVDIDEKALIAALQEDRERYEEAYHKGWRDCEKRYQAKMEAIMEIVNGGSEE